MAEPHPVKAPQGPTLASVAKEAGKLAADERLALIGQLIGKLNGEHRERALADAIATLPEARRQAVLASGIGTLPGEDRVALASALIAKLDAEQRRELTDHLVATLSAALDALEHRGGAADLAAVRRQCAALTSSDRDALLTGLAAAYPASALRAVFRQMSQDGGSTDEKLLAAEAADVLRRYAGDVVLAD